MNISKKVIALSFLITGFIGGMLVGYMQMNKNNSLNFLSQSAIMWIYSFVYIGFLASWFMLFDYVKRLENEDIQS